MLSKEQQIFAQQVGLWLAYVYNQKYSITFGETYRTPEQAELNAKKGIGIKDSLHCKRLALDFNLFDPNGNLVSDFKEYEKFGAYWESLDKVNRWGGRWKPTPEHPHQVVDLDHIERNAVI